MKEANQKSKIKMQDCGANFAPQNLHSICLRRIAALGNFDICILHFDFRAKRGFTLIETLVAVSLLTIAIVAPMSLTTQSLSSAHYAKEQITAFHLAQEAIESIRHVRDGNVLKIARGDLSVDLMGVIPKNNALFIVNTLDDAMKPCGGLPCPPLQKNNASNLYGYWPNCSPPAASCGGAQDGWTNTIFTRAVKADFVAGTDQNEMLVEVEVSWETAGGHPRSFSISENLYRWVKDSSAI